MNNRVLLVEDDERLSSVVINYLELKGFVCDHSFCAENAQSLAAKNSYDIIITDINMNKMSGFDFCKWLRSETIDTLVIMLTSRSSLNDKEIGFSAGADDYLTKPFELKELELRIKALLARQYGRLGLIKIEKLALEIDTNKRLVLRENKEICLSKSGWRIILRLAQSWPNPVSKPDLEHALWGDEPPDRSSLKAHIHLLRQRIDKPFTTPLIQSIPSYGYVLGANSTA